MTGRKPRPGDRVLIRATVAAQQNQIPDDDVLTVVVPTPRNPALVLIILDTVAEVLGPEWLPAQDRDVVLDRDGHAWQYVEYDDGRGLWHCVLGADFGTDDLLDQFGPVTLVARGGKPVDR